MKYIVKEVVDPDSRMVIATDSDGQEWVRKRDVDKLCRVMNADYAHRQKQAT